MIYKIPALDTVAFEANLRSLISKNILILGFKSIRSLFGNVKTLLSSMTEFIFSIQCASKSPSSIIHFWFLSSAVLIVFIILDKIPYLKSLVWILIYLPYKSLLSIDLGFKSFVSVFTPYKSNALAKVRHVAVLPEPALPIMKTEWRISISSFNWTHFKINPGSFENLKVGGELSSSIPFAFLFSLTTSQASSTFFSKFISRLRSTSTLGNKSPIKPSNIGISSWTIFG